MENLTHDYTVNLEWNEGKTIQNGKVVAGSEVVDAIEKVKTGRKGFHDDVPLEDVVITKAVEV